MNLSATCPNCSMTLPVPPEALGRSLRCPNCKVVFAAPAAPPPAPPPGQYPPGYPYPYPPAGYPYAPYPPPAPAPVPPAPPPPPAPFAFDDKSASGAEDDDHRPARRRYKPAKGANPVVITAALVIATVVGLGVRYAFTVLRAPEVIPDSAWKTLDVPGVLRVKLPGPTNLQSINAGGVGLTMQLCTPSEDALYGVAHSEPLPAQRLALSPEKLLNDACDGSKDALAKQGGSEISRESITLESNKSSFPGKQLVVNVPKGNGKLVYRIYLARDRLVMLMAGARGWKWTTRT